MRTIYIFPLLFAAALLCVIPSCSSAQKKSNTAVIPQADISALEGIEGVWEDSETLDLHTIKKNGNGYTVLSVVEYGEDGEMTETMKIVSCSFVNGVLSWSYHVPSTGYTVFFSTVELNGDSLIINWSNTDNAGGTRSGQETLRRVLGKNDTDSIPVFENENGSDNVFGGKPFGKIYKISEEDIIVACKEAGDESKEGDILYIVIDGEKIELEVLVPMQTVINCRLTEKNKGRLEQIEKGMTVYK